MILSETETLIWDWNGTLLDDVEVNVKVINEMLSKRNLPLLDINTYKEIFCFPVKQFHIRIGIDFEKNRSKRYPQSIWNVIKTTRKI